MYDRPKFRPDPSLEEIIRRANAAPPSFSRQQQVPYTPWTKPALSNQEVVLGHLIVDVDLSNNLRTGVGFNLLPQTTIGRNVRNTIVLPHEIIGDEDTRMWVHNGRWYVRDVGGVYSTWVNDEPCRNRFSDDTLVASYGDNIFIGSIKFKLVR
jgi:hypothetical protein